eukprot:Colp12_sorted_trinity150504_noHs@6412
MASNGVRHRNTSGSKEKEKEAPAPAKETTEEAPVQLLAEQPSNKKWRDWWVRVTLSWVMVGGFCVVVAAGHLYLTLMVLCIQMMCFKEIIAIGHKIVLTETKEQKLPWYRTLNWYFLMASNYYLYGHNLGYYFEEYIQMNWLSKVLMEYHDFISLSLYTLGFVGFVLSLKKGFYKFQFRGFAWTHMTLLLIVTQSHLIISNIFEGLIWFILPAFLVVCNDVWAYIFGFFFGKTPLIQLSPKKTWEGFIGAFFATLLFGFILSWFLVQAEFFICPIASMGLKPAILDPSSLHCERHPVFTLTAYALPKWILPIAARLGLGATVNLYPIQLHALAMATFASIIAPFGGFFASGFKRAYQIKDFGDSIPGHGGLTDRFDCQYLMATFASVYHSTFIHQPNINKVLSAVLMLSLDQQKELLKKLQEHLSSDA